MFSDCKLLGSEPSAPSAVPAAAASSSTPMSMCPTTSGAAAAAGTALGALLQDQSMLVQQLDLYAVAETTLLTTGTFLHRTDVRFANTSLHQAHHIG